MYKVNILNGEEIRISDIIYNVFKDNIDEINLMISKSTREGTRYQEPEISKEYLESLLK